MKKFLTIYIFTSLFLIGCKKDSPEQVEQPAFTNLSFSILKDTLYHFDSSPLVEYEWKTVHCEGVGIDGIYGGSLPPNFSEIFPAKWGNNEVSFSAIGEIEVINGFQYWNRVYDTILKFNIDSSMIFE